jgi:hypothetical protein
VIGDFAFRGCRALTSIVLPETVSTIGFFAFKDCTALKSVEIRSTNIQIRVGAFDGCTSLEHIYVQASMLGYYKNRKNKIYQEKVIPIK